MADPNADMAVLARLPDDKIHALADMLDESIIIRLPESAKIREIADTHLSESDVSCIINVFYNFFASQANPQPIIQMVDAASLQENKKNVLKEVLESIHKKIDTQKITQMQTIATLDVIGHPHFHRFDVYTELRPVSNDGKITKLIPKLVITGVLGEPHTHIDRTISIQMDPKEGHKLVKDITSQLEALETEVRFMQGKLGDDVVD